MNFQGYGVALNNEAAEIMRVGEALGPITLMVENEGSVEVVLSAHKLSDGSVVHMDKDTVVASENTGYSGNNSDLAFTGQTLNNLPIVPGTVVITPQSGGSTVLAQDTNGDGILWTVDTVPAVCGTINYFTGALELSYPAGHAPNTGVINAAYYYQDHTVNALGKKVLQLQNLPPTETFVIKAAGKAGNSPVRIDAVITF